MSHQYRKLLEEHEHLEAPFGPGAFGAKAEAFARFFGTPKFLIAQTLVVATWILINATHLVHFDLYPFILLNLAFSTQAAYAAPLILLAGNRAALRDRMTLEHTAAEADLEDAQNRQLIEADTQILERIAALEQRILDLEKRILERLDGRPDDRPTSA